MDKRQPKGFENSQTEEQIFKKVEQKKEQGVPIKRRGKFNVVEKPKNATKTLSKLFTYFKRCKKLFILLIIAVIAVTATTSIAPSLQGFAIDAIKDGEWHNLKMILISLLIVYIIQIGCNLSQTMLSAKLSQKIVEHMRFDLFKKMTHLSIGYLDTHSSGDVMSRMTNDIENISNTISQSLGSLISGVLTIIVTIIIMMIYCPQLTLISLTTVILTIVVTKFMSKKMNELYKKKSNALGMVNGHAEEMVTGYKTILAYNKQSDVNEEFDNLSDELTRVGIKAEILRRVSWSYNECNSKFKFCNCCSIWRIFCNQWDNYNWNNFSIYYICQTIFETYK